MTDTPEPGTATHRATAAAEALAAEGFPVTARAVRERSGVNMGLAATIAREWNQHEHTHTAVPPVPVLLVPRLEAVWAEAVTLARAEHAAEREGWQQRVLQLETERDGLTRDLTTTEDALDALNAQTRHLQAHAEQLAEHAAAQLAEQRSRADRAEARADTLAEERDRLVTERDHATHQLQQHGALSPRSGTPKH